MKSNSAAQASPSQTQQAAPPTWATFSDMIEDCVVDSEVTYTGTEVEIDNIAPDVRTQILAAVGSNHAVADLYEAFESVDNNEIVVTDFHEPKTGMKLTSVDFGAGDNTFGAVFRFGETKPFARIVDGDLEVI